MKKNLKLTLLFISLSLLLQTGTLYSSSNKNFTDPATGMEFVFVEGGCFQMGDSFGEEYVDELPLHEVYLDDFYIAKYEVTQGEYKKIIGDNPSTFRKGDNYPVEGINWMDAQLFIEIINGISEQSYRLPTEAEWEYAARSGGKKEKYAGGNLADDVAWHDGNSGGSTHPVGSKSPNGLGVYDMSGNVREWCQDWFGPNYYKSSPNYNPQGPTGGDRRVIRGGGWRRTEKHVRSSYRDGNTPDDRRNNLGLRLVLSNVE